MRHIFFLIAALTIPAALFAHGVEASLGTGGAFFAACTVRFCYSTGEDMSFAKIKLYSPASPDVDVLQGITDMAGYFSFVPAA